MADIPDSVRNAALAALRQRQPDLVVADLDPVDPTPDESTAPAGRALSFSTAERHIEVLADDPAPAGVHLHITLDPPASASVEIWHPGELLQSGYTDADGVIDLDGVPPGPVSVVCRFAEDGVAGLQTSWVTI
jgi:hypothetical protein